MLVTRREVAWLLALILVIAGFKAYQGPSDVEMAQSWSPVTTPATSEPFAPPPATTTEPRPVVTTATVVWVDPVPTRQTALDQQDTTTTTEQVYDTNEYRCHEWIGTAVDVGWPEYRLDVLDDIMWGESRCDPTQVSSTNDWGLLQVNRKVWRGYVEAFGLTMDDLLVPEVNLWIGLQIADIAAYEYGWRWCQPWDMSSRRAC